MRAGTTHATLAEELGVCLDTARKWRARFCNNGVDGLADGQRPDRVGHPGIGVCSVHRSGGSFG
ncbi:MAG: helix-turn-helix domain-containing protein [Mycobacterium sp.]